MGWIKVLTDLVLIWEQPKWSALALFYLWTQTVHICIIIPARIMQSLLYFPKMFLILRSVVAFEATPSYAEAIFSSLCLAPTHTINTKTNIPTPVAAFQEFPLISPELYIFLIRNETQH